MHDAGKLRTKKSPSAPIFVQYGRSRIHGTDDDGWVPPSPYNCCRRCSCRRIQTNALGGGPIFGAFVSVVFARTLVNEPCRSVVWPKYVTANECRRLGYCIGDDEQWGNTVVGTHVGHASNLSKSGDRVLSLAPAWLAMRISDSHSYSRGRFGACNSLTYEAIEDFEHGVAYCLAMRPPQSPPMFPRSCRARLPQTRRLPGLRSPAHAKARSR
jgi:hypothetical protein